LFAVYRLTIFSSNPHGKKAYVRYFFIMKTISFMQYKGGSGKTTVAALLSRVLSGAGYRVLAVDLDKYQYHLSMLLGGSLSPELCGPRSSTAYASGVLSRMVQKTADGLLDCITLCGSLCDPHTRDAFQLRKRISFFNFSAQYDYILIDTPPGFGGVHDLAIHASNDIILPTDLSPISLSAIERFCVDFDKRPELSTVHCSILRNCVKPSHDATHVLNRLRQRTKARVAPHSLAADERVRAATSGCCDFLAQRLPRRIISQLVHIAVDLLHADRVRLESTAADLSEVDWTEGHKDREAVVFEGLLNAPPSVTVLSGVPVTAS
jgi:cellulose biosynthesis protein BcsQ